MPKDYIARTGELQVAVQFVRENMVRLRIRRDENFPDPEGSLRTLSELNLRLHLWIAHFVNHNCSNFSDGLKANAFLRNNDGSIPLIRWWKPERGAIIDFTRQEAKEWWKSQLRPLLEKGVVGFKIDGGNEGAFVTDLRQFQDGRNGREMHNIYPLIYADCVSDMESALTDADLCAMLQSCFGAEAHAANDVAFAAPPES